MLYLCQAIIMRFRIFNLGYNLKAALRWQDTILFTSQEYGPPTPLPLTQVRVNELQLHKFLDGIKLLLSI